MKKIYSLAFTLALCSQVDAQILNEPAGWPNTNWTITGDYNTDPLAFEADPTTTANFAFDDDDAGGTFSEGHEDNIAAESPIIDLNAAFSAGEKSLEISVSYAFNKYGNDVLQFQYWDADAAAWTPWGGDDLPENSGIFDDFCSSEKTLYTSAGLDISNFTASQLAGFRYRIFYDDDLEGAAWNFGFCLDSPTLISVACSGVTSLTASSVIDDSANLTWGAVSGVAGYEYALDEVEAEPASGTATTETTFLATDLTPETVYYFHLRTDCGGVYGPWRTVTFTTKPLAPANDACVDAIVVDAFPYTNTEDATTATNNDGVIAACGSGMNDGVWYSFTGDGLAVSVTLSEVDGWDPELGVYSGTCGDFTCVQSADIGGGSVGETINFTTEAGVVYYVNVGHYNGSEDVEEGPFSITIDAYVAPEPPANDACVDAIVVDAFPYTNAQDATAATNNDGVITACAGGMNDGVWYSFTGDGSGVSVMLTDVDGWDPEIGVYSGTCGDFTCVTSADGGGNSGDETVEFTAQAGVVYYVNIGHYNDSEDREEGPFTVTFDTFVPPVLPENDTCATATAIGALPYTNSQDATGATNNDGNIDTCGGGMNDGVWYTFTGDGSDITVAISDIGEWDPELAVYTGTCGDFACVGSADDGGESDGETVTVAASVVGTTYYVNVANFTFFGDGDEGQYSISVSSALATTAFTNSDFKSYPNPVADVLNVSYTKNITGVTVFNMLGQQVLSQSVNATTGKIDVSSLNGGTYIVKVASGSETKTIKIIKM